ncbi:MAG: ankyrin repeat domain-containing protein, partial [Shimia sp.]
MTTDPLSPSRRSAKRLERAYARGDADARQMIANVARSGSPKHADFLHAIARQEGFTSWPALKAEVEVHGLDRAQAVLALRRAYFNGDRASAERISGRYPELAAASFGTLCAAHDVDAVALRLSKTPELAVRAEGPRRPLLHLCFSRAHRWVTGGTAKSVEIAKLLLRNGADVNDTMPASPDDPGPLSALYGAL